jgi:hypothetical protein
MDKGRNSTQTDFGPTPHGRGLAQWPIWSSRPKPVGEKRERSGASRHARHAGGGATVAGGSDDKEWRGLVVEHRWGWKMRWARCMRHGSPMRWRVRGDAATFPLYSGSQTVVDGLVS